MRRSGSGEILFLISRCFDPIWHCLQTQHPIRLQMRQFSRLANAAQFGCKVLKNTSRLKKWPKLRGFARRRSEGLFGKKGFTGTTITTPGRLLRAVQSIAICKRCCLTLLEHADTCPRRTGLCDRVSTSPISSRVRFDDRPLLHSHSDIVEIVAACRSGCVVCFMKTHDFSTPGGQKFHSQAGPIQSVTFLTNFRAA
jgi:hypothetical protein